MPLDKAVFDRIKNGDRAARDEVFNANTGLIWASVKRFAGLMEQEDLYQLGAIGLLKAINRFDPDYGARFSTFAVPHILGEMRRFLRDNTPVKVERRLKEVAYQARKTASAMKAKTGIEPPVSEVALALGVAIDIVLSALEATSEVVYLEDVPAYREQASAITDSAPESMVESLDLRKAIAVLGPNERAILESRFFAGKTQSEISAEIGISQAHVSRLEKKALAALKAYLLEKPCVDAMPVGDTTKREKTGGDSKAGKGDDRANEPRNHQGGRSVQ